MTEPLLSLIVARGRNGVIGADGELPWRLRDDLAFFKKTTAGCPLIMGRKTWESLPRKPLPGRANIVLSRNIGYLAPGARVYASLATAKQAGLAIANTARQSQVFVIGGAAVYALALPKADRIYLTEVDAEPAGDTFLPPIVDSQWRETQSWPHAADERNAHDFVIRQLDRR